MKLKLQSPLKFFSITQRFGNTNKKLYGNTGHGGLDLYAPHGTPIYASTDGFISYQIDDGGGHGLVLVTDKKYKGLDGKSSLWKTIYWHLPDPLKEPKLASPFADKTGFTKVKTGELIGYADNTGKSTGDHLHLGLKPVAKGEDWGTYYNLKQKNGFNGAIDPLPYLELKFSSKTLRLGDTGEDVKQLQGLLACYGFWLPFDGKFGKKTETIVKTFQKDNGLVVDGIVGKKTLKKLNPTSSG